GQCERVGRLEEDDGQVRLRVRNDARPAGLLVGGEAHRDAVGAADYVEVRQDVAPLVDDDARAEPRLVKLLTAPWSAPEELVEKVFERRVVGERPEGRGAAEAGDLHRADVDHGRSDALGHTDKGRLPG